MSLLGVTSSSAPQKKKSSSFLSRLKGSGGIHKTETEESTGLKSLLYAMSKDKSSSDHLLLQDEDEGSVWEAVEKANQTRVEIHLTTFEVVVLSLPEKYEKYRVPLHMISSLKLSSHDLTFFWHNGDRREARAFKMENPKKLYTKFFDVVSQRLKENEEENGGGFRKK